MEPNGIFLNRSFKVRDVTTPEELEQSGADLCVNSTSSPQSEKSFVMAIKSEDRPKTRSSLLSPPTIVPSQRKVKTEHFSSTKVRFAKVNDWKDNCSTTPTRASVEDLNESKNRLRILRKSATQGSEQCYKREEDNNDDEQNDNTNDNNNYTVKPTVSLCNSEGAKLTSAMKPKSKSGVRRIETSELVNKTCDETEEIDRDAKGEDQEAGNSLQKYIRLEATTSLLTWKLPSFLCLPFTRNDANSSYLHLMSKSRKSSGILSLTTFVLVVTAVILASVPAPVMSASATEFGESSSLVADDINSNDVTPHDYLTTSSSIMPVKLQTITFTSHEGTTPEDSALFSSAATGRTTGGGTGPAVTRQTGEGIRQEPSMNDFAGWRDADTLTAHSGEMETASEKTLHEDSLLRKDYEFKSGFPELKNETREALQEEGSNHQPVVFVGGSGYVPPNSVRTRPEGDPLWQNRPVAESRYPVPLQSAWDRNYRNPFNMTRVQHIEAECQDDFMKIRVAMNGSFHGLIYSSGYSYDPDCVYVNGTGRDYYEYLIKLNRCGTLGASNHVEGRREPSKNFMWNTVTVQYNPMIEEEWDEHFKVTCEYGYDFWKTVTFPFLDVEVATGNPVVFTLTPPECYMEVRYGFGTAGTRVGGPVRVGDPLTLMINMRSQYDGFDIVVNDCYAHNGATKRIQLIDHYGCPVDSKLMSPFRGTWSHTNLYETQVYAYLKTFRFTGSPALYIECDVRMCHGQCPSQPCYWRNVKSVSKRSTDTQMITDSDKNTTLSENLSLFQSLRVLQEDEDTEAAKSSLESNESVCMKTGAFTAMIGLSTFILVILTVSTMIMCFRIRRVKVIEERETATDILRPYSHHVSQPAQQHHPHQRHHHWSSAKPR